MFRLYCLKCGSKDVEIKKDVEYLYNCCYEDNYIILCRNCNIELDFNRLLSECKNT